MDTPQSGAAINAGRKKSTHTASDNGWAMQPEEKHPFVVAIFSTFNRDTSARTQTQWTMEYKLFINCSSPSELK